MYASPSIRRLATGAFTILALACGGDAITAGPSVDGTYSLRTINGAALPVTLTDMLDGIPAQITFLAPSTFTLGTDKSVRIITTVRIVYGSLDVTQADTSFGTYAMTGQQVTFSQPGSSSFTGTWNGSNMLTVADESGVFVFTK
jgi:hypothetical protein